MAPATIAALRLRKKKKVEVTGETIMGFVEAGFVKGADAQEDMDPDIMLNPIAVQRITAEKEKARRRKKKEREAKKKANETKKAALTAERVARAAQAGKEPAEPKEEINYFTASTDRDTGGGAFAKLGISVDQKHGMQAAKPSKEILDISAIDAELDRLHGKGKARKEAKPEDDRAFREAQAAALEAQRQSMRDDGGLGRAVGAIAGLFARDSAARNSAARDSALHDDRESRRSPSQFSVRCSGAERSASSQSRGSATRDRVSVTVSRYSGNL